MGQKKIVIGTAEASPGKKGKGFIHVAYRPDGTPINIPLFILNGASDGPVLCVDGCNHGDEHETMEAVLRVVDLIDPSVLRGTLLAVPVVNVLAYEAMQRVIPWDIYSYSDINRIYPGKLEGSITQKIAYQHFSQVVCQAEYLLNCHAAGNYYILTPQVILFKEEGELGEKISGLARAFGCDILRQKREIKGGGDTEVLVAAKRGIAGITPEIGGAADRLPANRDRNVSLYVKGILNVMKHLGMIDGSPEIPKKYWVIEGDSYYYAKKGGLFSFERDIIEKTGFPQSKLKVRKGQKLGKIVNLFGEEVESVNAPADGLLCSARTFPLVHPGDFVFSLGNIVEEGF